MYARPSFNYIMAVHATRQATNGRSESSCTSVAGTERMLTAIHLFWQRYLMSLRTSLLLNYDYFLSLAYNSNSNNNCRFCLLLSVYVLYCNVTHTHMRAFTSPLHGIVIVVKLFLLRNSQRWLRRFLTVGTRTSDVPNVNIWDRWSADWHM